MHIDENEYKKTNKKTFCFECDKIMVYSYVVLLLQKGGGHCTFNDSDQLLSREGVDREVCLNTGLLLECT